jgi:GGDEF domain-containing protein
VDVSIDLLLKKVDRKKPPHRKGIFRWGGLEFMILLICVLRTDPVNANLADRILVQIIRTKTKSHFLSPKLL